MAAWAGERLHIAAMETEAEANGCPPGGLKLFGSIDDDTFACKNPAHRRNRGWSVFMENETDVFIEGCMDHRH